ncbi:hypothetical protein EL17_10635 [Anditalea andensis]|uniref:Uncharacterized protein n=2 Tax=Anditalea andensis TaxID=1048983 RepID=A0A074KZR1_9BACT|nr:hypothetical protein EL17_10635 [Anditalea andensis]
MLSDQLSDNKEKDLPMPTTSVTEYVDLEQYAVNKVIPDEIRDVTLLALSHFPELMEVEIDFDFKKKIRGSVMQAQPKVGSLLFNSKSNRKYRINISRYLELDDEWLPIEEVPENVLLGWIGHELGHIMDYLDKSRLGLISFGVRYVTSNAFVTQAEITADSYAVAGGLGNNLVDTKNFILNHDRLPEEYRNKIRDLYMSPGEIMTLVDVEEDDDDDEVENAEK